MGAVREFFRPTTEAVQPGHVFAAWVQGAVLTATFTAIALLNEAGPLQIGLVVVNVGLLSFLVLHKVTNKGAARIIVAIMCVIGLGLLGWSVWNKRVAAAQYELTLIDVTVLRDGYDLPNGDGQVTSINPQIDVGNKYDFPIYYKITRRFGKTAYASTALDNPEAEIGDIKPNMALFVHTDNLEGQLENGKYHQAQVEFEILYGKTRKLEKRFRYTADLTFFLCPRSGLLCGPVTMTNATTTNEWIAAQD